MRVSDAPLVWFNVLLSIANEDTWVPNIPARVVQSPKASGRLGRDTPDATSVARVWGLLESIGFDHMSYWVRTILKKCCIRRSVVQSGYSRFSHVLRSPEVSAHVKAIIREFDSNTSRLQQQ